MLAIYLDASIHTLLIHTCIYILTDPRRAKNDIQANADGVATDHLRLHAVCMVGALYCP